MLFGCNNNWWWIIVIAVVIVLLFVNGIIFVFIFAKVLSYLLACSVKLVSESLGVSLLLELVKLIQRLCAKK